MGNSRQLVSTGIGVMFLLLFGISANIYAQQASVRGTVTDATSSETLPGVNIIIKGTSTGTSTDAGGAFELPVSSLNDTLVVSFIGYETQNIPINGREQIDVQLNPATVSGDEVVVTALGITRNERHLGYSVTNVLGNDLAEANANNPVEALQGKAAGVDISGTDGGIFGGSKFSIRGASTLDSNNMPIFVVDGVILQNATSGESEWGDNPSDWGNQLRNLNPDNFQSASILKGSAATALYGSRAINGAVVIETKDGNAGGGLGIQVSQTTGITYVYDTPDLQNEFGPGTIAGYVSYGEQDANGDYYRFDTGQFNYRTVDDGQEVPSLIGTSGLNFGPRFSSQDRIQGYDEEMTSYRPYPDNWKNAYDTGVTSRTNITLSGGADKLSFYVNSSIDLNKGIYPRQQLDKYSGILKASYDFSDYLTVRGSISYTHSVPQNPPVNFGDDFTAYDFNRAYSTKKYKRRDVFVADHGGVPSNAFGNEYANVPGNGLWFSVYENSDRRVENTWRPILSINADVTEWLSLTLEGNMNVFDYTSETKNLGQGYRNEGGYYRFAHHTEQQETGKFTAQLTRDLGDFGFDATVGGEIFHTKTTESGANTEGGLVVPGRFFLENSRDQRTNWAWIGEEKQISSIYGLFSFSWRDQLYLDLTGRNDWSSALVYAGGTGDYSFFYPSVSASWIFNETLELPDWISFGKLRASWAQVGNDTDPYIINQGYSVGTIRLGNGNIYTNDFDRTLISPTLSPEQKRSYELGTNLRFFSDRLGIDVTWYKENTFDQIVDIPAPYTSGVTTQKINAGNIQNQGIEVSLDVTPVQTQNFNWDMTLNYTRNRNKILSLHEDVGDYQLLAGSPAYGNYRIGSAAYIGGDYGVLLSDILPAKYQATDEDGEDVDHPNNGKKVLNYDNTSRSAYYQRSSEVQKVGSIQPDFLGSVSNMFRYKNLSLSFLIDGRFGGHVASFTNRYGTAWGFLETSTRNLDAENGGMTWTSQYPDIEGRTYEDGVIPDGVFADGTMITTPAGNQQDVGGMTFEEAYDAGYVEPSHASTVTYFNNSWGDGTINDDWFYELSYVSLRQIGISYTLPVSFTQQLGVQNVRLGLRSRNVLYLYNSSPNNMNPETFRGNQSDYSYFERTPSPYSRSVFFTLDLSI